LTFVVAALLAGAAGAGIFVRGIYRDAPDWVLQARAQDAVSLVVVVPVLLIAAAWLGRSRRLQLVWLGALAYLVYAYAIVAFDVRFNALFPAYVALLGLPLYLLIFGLIRIDAAALARDAAPGLPVRTAAIVLGVIGGGFAVLWLSDIVRAIVTQTVPASITLAVVPTNPVYVLDLAWMIPALFITVAGLRRRQPFAIVLAGAALSFIVLMGLAVLAIFALTLGETPATPPEPAIAFGIVVAASAATLWSYLRRIR
jgi:hypothetical protein